MGFDQKKYDGLQLRKACLMTCLLIKHPAIDPKNFDPLASTGYIIQTSKFPLLFIKRGA